MRILIVLLAVATIGLQSPAPATGSHVRTGEDEMKQNTGISLNGPWHFRIDPEDRGIAERWFAAVPPPGEWDTLRVPAFWDQLRDLSSYDGYAWYVRDFDLPEAFRGRIALVFEAVDDNADIWLNGTRIGSHVGYGQRFFFEITTAVKEKHNVLAIRIEDLAGPGGLIGDVTLRTFTEEVELLRSRFFDMQSVNSADWVRDAVIYEVFPRAFSAEGSFAAIEQRLPELRQLGVTVLWLMPVHPIGEVKRKGTLGSPYSVRDYYGINPEFGTLEDFRSLLARTHALGMRLIIDLVANHTAWDNPLITAHPEWYRKNSQGEIIPPNAGWYDVAALDYDNPALRRYMRDMMLYWVRDIGIDGFRCDVAELVPYDFWVDVIDTLRSVKSVMMLAEGADPRLHIDAFDITYAWNTYDILQPMVEGELPASQLATTLRREQYQYPQGALRLRFTTNHDKNKEDGPPVEHLGVEGARSCAVLTHLLPGVPLIYNGQETGSDRALELFDDVEVDWQDSGGFRSLYRQLNALRAAHATLRQGDYVPLDADGSAAVAAYARRLEDSCVAVIVNLSDEQAEIRLTLPAQCRGSVLLADGCRVEGTPVSTMRLAPWGYVVMK
ncbi:MAG: alpha-amylase family glycosyl hydrolase [Bacteroidota bacterium]|nr:alpha-amylase family glycosyl hydrolase [Bacteroidota bacterium]